MIELENLARRFQDVKEDYFQSLERISKNENVVNGNYVALAEQKLRELSGRKYAALVRTGSNAITISLQSYVAKGAEVIIPNYSCPATLSSVVVAGCIPRFVEINEYGSIDASQIQSHLTKNTKAILATGLYGDVHDHDTIKEICDKNNLVYVNDAAQSQFALYKGTNSLELGDVVCMSFAENKPLPTLGTFGAVLTDSEQHYKAIRVLRKNGKPSRMEQYATAGYSSHPDEDKAAQLLASMKHFDAWQERRRQVAKMYDEGFAKAGIKTRKSPAYSTYNTHKYVIFVDDKFSAYEKLLSAGLQTAQHYVDNFAKLSWTPDTSEQFPMTDKFIQQGLSLPINAHITDLEVKQVIDIVVSNC